MPRGALTLPHSTQGTSQVTNRAAAEPAEAKQFFQDLAADQALPKDLIAGSAVAGTT